MYAHLKAALAVEFISFSPYMKNKKNINVFSGVFFVWNTKYIVYHSL